MFSLAAQFFSSSAMLIRSAFSLFAESLQVLILPPEFSRRSCPPACPHFREFPAHPLSRLWSGPSRSRTPSTTIDAIVKKIITKQNPPLTKQIRDISLIITNLPMLCRFSSTATRLWCSQSRIAAVAQRENQEKQNGKQLPPRNFRRRPWFIAVAWSDDFL